MTATSFPDIHLLQMSIILCSVVAVNSLPLMYPEDAVLRENDNDKWENMRPAEARDVRNIPTEPERRVEAA